MLYAYFGGLGIDKRSCYELLLEQTRLQYTVTAVNLQYRSSGSMVPRVIPWRWHCGSPVHAPTMLLYRGQDARLALLTLFRAARAANLADHGQRYCYVLPSVPAYPGTFAGLLPTQLRYDDSLLVHPQLWQVGRPLDTLPVERHAQACMDVRLFGEERTRWTIA